MFSRRKPPPLAPHQFDDELALIATGRQKIAPRELQRSQLVMLEKLGSGAFGTVNKALMNEKTEHGVPS